MRIGLADGNGDDLLLLEEIEEILVQLEEEWNEIISRKKRG
ncbi:hypothetical protein [Paenibacillus solani]|nr:hypothetical protein [Paenibacillus solani]